MQAVILAAGIGSRLSPATGGAPKCMVEVGGVSLLRRHLNALAWCGVDDIVLVVGHRAEEVRDALSDLDVAFVTNPVHRETNSLYSLALAASLVTRDAVVINADVLAHPEIYRRVVASEGTSLAYDPTSGTDPEHMKVAIDNGRVTAMSKVMECERVAGENVGILKIGDDDRAAFFEGAEALLAAPGGSNAWAPAAMDRLAAQRRVRPVDVADLPWVEIDFPADLDHAHSVTWPRILGRPVNRFATV